MSAVIPPRPSMAGALGLVRKDAEGTETVMREAAAAVAAAAVAGIVHEDALPTGKVTPPPSADEKLPQFDLPKVDLPEPDFDEAMTPVGHKKIDPALLASSDDDDAPDADDAEDATIGAGVKKPEIVLPAPPKPNLALMATVLASDAEDADDVEDATIGGAGVKKPNLALMATVPASDVAKKATATAETASARKLSPPALGSGSTPPSALEAKPSDDSAATAFKTPMAMAVAKRASEKGGDKTDAKLDDSEPAVPVVRSSAPPPALPVTPPASGSTRVAPIVAPAKGNATLAMAGNPAAQSTLPMQGPMPMPGAVPPPGSNHAWQQQAMPIAQPAAGQKVLGLPAHRFALIVSVTLMVAALVFVFARRQAQPPVVGTSDFPPAPALEIPPAGATAQPPTLLPPPAPTYAATAGPQTPHGTKTPDRADRGPATRRPPPSSRPRANIPRGREE